MRLSILFGVMAICCLFAPDAWAQGGGIPGGCGTDVFDVVRCKMWSLWHDVRDTVFIMGGFGLVGLAVAAIFGQVNWKWFGALAFGLTILAVAGAALEYTTGSDYIGTVFTDTLN